VPDFIEVKFKGERKEWYTNPQQLPFRIGDLIIVEAEKGEDLGRVNQVELPARVSVSQNDGVKKALRRANENEVVRHQGNKVAEQKSARNLSSKGCSP
jgi:hypothetical protein